MTKNKIELKSSDHISVRELAFKIKSVDHHIAHLDRNDSISVRKPQYAFFLGAGASVDSGVLSAGEMIKIFKDEIFQIHCPDLQSDLPKEEWLINQTGWYKAGKEEYGCLFEQFAATKVERQRFIEGICEINPVSRKLVEPSFGYVVLADLISKNYTDTIITTNFDDLVYIACTSFTGNRPIVYAYGILASEMRMVSPHPKVLKLHGDYLFSNIVNTSHEMLVQSKVIDEIGRTSRDVISRLNMERQVKAVLNNFGVIVIGYSGKDKTVMELLRKVSKENGFFWCYVKGFPPDDEVIDLVRDRNGKFVKIDSFDRLMKEISEVIGFSLDDLLSSFDQKREKLKKLYVNFAPEYISESLTQYVLDLERVSQDKLEKNTETRSPVDYYIMGLSARNEGDHDSAEKYYRKAIELDQNYSFPYQGLAVLLSHDPKRWEEAEQAYERAIELNPNDEIAYNNLGVLLQRQGRIKEAIEKYKTSLQLDKDHAAAYVGLASIYKKLGNPAESKKFSDKAMAVFRNDDYYNWACLYSILENKDKALEYLQLAAERVASAKIMAREEPDFEWIRDDSRFWEIIL